ncbi:aspartic peptidase domain-containing protein [Suillus spraguei]|nr:aspartic peptidase domain-containing protein [Suillus spraguei]
MFSTVPLLTLLALSVTGSLVEVRNSSITLPITRRLKFSNGTNLLQHDEARVAAFRDNSTHGRRANIILDNEKWSYTVSVGIGNPPTYYNLIIDTGGAVTWVGVNKGYERTDSSVMTPWRVAVNYKFGFFFAGILFTDILTFGDSFTAGMRIGATSYYDEGMAYNGVLGIGPAGLSVGTVTNKRRMELETITQCLFDTGRISQPLVGIFFQPSIGDEDDAGTLNFGEPNPVMTTMFTGSIAYTYWGIEQSITYGTTEILSNAPGIVESSSTYNYLASDAYENYRVATGAKLDARTNLLSITLEQYDGLHPLEFHIGDQTYSFTRNAQIWPRHLNYKVNGLDDGIYLTVKSLDTPVGHGLDFQLGYVFLQRFYAVFDIAESRVGFAETLFTDATTN